MAAGDEQSEEPRRVLCGLVRRQARLLASFPIALLLLSPRAKTTEHLAGFLLLARLAAEIYRVMGRHGVTGGGSVGIVQSAPVLQRSDLG